MKKTIISTLALSAILLAGCTQTTPTVPSGTAVPTTTTTSEPSPAPETSTATQTPTAEGTKNLDAFAKCLTEKGAMIYTSPTCSHCMAQKELFGDSFQYINNIDCMKNPTQCGEIKAVPNWVINGENLLGEQSLETLSQKSGCPL